MHIADEDHQKILAWAQLHVEIAEVWLFGSRARGDHESNSDIDLAVLTTGSEIGQRQLRWMEADWRKSLRLKQRVHLEYFDPEIADWSETVAPAVKRDGILLYRRPPNSLT